MTGKPSPHISFTRSLIIICLALAALAVFWLIIHEIIYEKEDDIDAVIMNFINRFVNPRLTGLMKGITFFGSQIFLITAYVLLTAWFLFYRKNQPIALTIAVTGTIGFFLVVVLKNVVRRERPPAPLIEAAANFSFPSGHTTSAFIFFGLLIYLVWQTQWSNVYKYVSSIFLFIVAMLVGISRIYLGMHFASDVAGGFCLGFMWLIISLLLLSRLTGSTSFKSDS